jgi:hypothetical protein
MWNSSIISQIELVSEIFFPEKRILPVDWNKKYIAEWSGEEDLVVT